MTAGQRPCIPLRAKGLIIPEILVTRKIQAVLGNFDTLDHQFFSFLDIWWGMVPKVKIQNIFRKFRFLGSWHPVKVFGPSARNTKMRFWLSWQSCKSVTIISIDYILIFSTTRGRVHMLPLFSSNHHGCVIFLCQ